MAHHKARWLFFRTLSTMVSAGIPLHLALEDCGRQFHQPMYRELFQEIARDLRRGHPFSQGIGRHAWFFEPFHRFLLTVAEQSGGLELVLRNLADYEGRNTALRQTLVSKLTYPAILFLVSLAALVLLPVFALEGIFQILESSGASLPTLTVLFIGASRLIRSPLGLLCLVAAGGGSWIVFRRAAGTLWVREKLFSVPGFGPVLAATAAARFASSLALQLEAGVMVMKALRSAAGTTGSALVVRQVGSAVEKLKKGALLQEALSEVSILSPTFLSMVAVGEETGRLPVLLKRMGRFYEEETERTLEALASLLEPLVLCVMGVLFAVMLLATMLPLVRLVETL